MSEKLYQQVVAIFLNAVLDKKGWWYRILINRFEKNTTNNVFHYMDEDVNRCFSALYIQTKAKCSPNHAKEHNSLCLPRFIKQKQ